MVPCIEISLKPKSSSEGLTQLHGYLAQSISLCDSDTKRRLCLCSWRLLSDCRVHTIYRVRLLTLRSKEGLNTVPGSLLLFYTLDTKPKRKRKKENDLRGKAYLQIPENHDVQSKL